MLFEKLFIFRFSVNATIEAYRGAILKLRQLQEDMSVQRGDAEKLFKVEHGILDILSQLVIFLLQSGNNS